MPQPAPEHDNDTISLFWATPEENRSSFVRGKHLGRLAVTALVIGGIALTGGALALPVWAVAAVAASVALSNALGAGMDQGNSCQIEMGDALAADVRLGASRARMLTRGFSGGVTGALKRLPFAILGTPFWPVLAVSIPFINKGTTGEYFPGFSKAPKIPPLQLQESQILPSAPAPAPNLPAPELLQYSFGAAVKRDTVGAPAAMDAAAAATKVTTPAPKPQA